MPPPLPAFSSQTRTLTLTPSPAISPRILASRTPTLTLSATPRFASRLHASAPCSPPSPLAEIYPYVAAEWEAIAKGWACSAAAVYCLSRAVPAAGRLPRALCGAGGAAAAARGGLAVAALAAARAAATYGQQALLWEAALRAAGRVRAHAFERLLARDVAFFEGGGGLAPGDVAHRITDEAADVADAVYSVLNTVVPTSLQLIAMGTQMVTISPILSLVAATIIPCMCLVVASLGKRLREISKEAHHSIATLAAYLNDVLPSMLAVKANNGEWKEGLRFQKLALDDLRKNLWKKKMKALIPQTVRATYIGALVVLCAESIAVSGSSFDAEGFISFLTALALLVEPIQDLAKAYNEYKQGEPALERLFDLRRSISEVTDKPNAVDLRSVKGDIKFCDVSFRYGKDMPPILDGVNLHIRSGETIALVGPSGGGKTTLAKLLLRLYHPQSGYILLDNHDIQDVQLQSLRTHVALVSQDAMLFSGTIAENIAYRDPDGDINMTKIVNAAKIANAEEFIKTLPEGFDSNIGQRGSTLSGGQKQRLSIARAIYQDTSILILDEATSALDTRSELLVKEALASLMANHTVLIIAHRLEMILMADRIVLVEGGKAREITKSDFLSHDGRLSSPATYSPNFEPFKI